MHCGPVKTDLVGHFSSADINPDISYDLNLNCTWTIKLWLDPDKLIELYLATLNLPSPAEECGSDYLEVTTFQCCTYFSYLKRGKNLTYRVLVK